MNSGGFVSMLSCQREVDITNICYRKLVPTTSLEAETRPERSLKHPKGNNHNKAPPAPEGKHLPALQS